MENIKEEIIIKLQKALAEMGFEDVKPELTRPQNEAYGDYTTNIAMTIFSNPNFKYQISNFKFPMEFANEIVGAFNSQFPARNASQRDAGGSTFNFINKVEAVAPGFINFSLSQDYFINQLSELLRHIEKVDMKAKSSKSEKIMVEYAHPNTHKEMHIGHMRTLITGEALSRIFESRGDKVFRANYQGDIGPHVAKALYGVQKIMTEENLTLEDVEKWTNSQRAHFLGRGYVKGNQDHEEHKEEMDKINDRLYSRSSEIWDLYETTRKWSLDYYDEFYTRFYTRFDRLFFESEVASAAKKIVEENIGKVFVRDEDGSVIFPGEKYGLHTRVFITRAGNPTYEGKDMGLGFEEYKAFPFDKDIHVVASEQAGYFKVIIKALELIDPRKFKDREYHLSMGMVNLTDKKMSSRTGEVLTVDWLIDRVKEKVASLVVEGKIKGEDLEQVSEEVVIGAIKYSVLKVGTGQNVAFDIEKSVSLDGNSGPYLQYTYARTRSVLAKAKFQISNFKFQISNEKLEPEELSVLRSLHVFPEVVGEAAKTYNPSIICCYLFDLAQKFNLFYQRHSILGSANVILSAPPRSGKCLWGETKDLSSYPQKKILHSVQNDNTRNFRLALTEGVGVILKNGLYLLGIKAPERM